jgi:3-dehydroquinate dehydratase type I
MRQIATPKACVSLGRGDIAELKRDKECAFAQGANHVEIRFDGLSTHDILSHQALDAFTPMRENLVFTLRSESQGGKFSGSVEDAMPILAVLASRNPMLLDIELEVATTHPELVREIKSQGVSVLISHHDTQRTPPGPTLMKTLRRMMEFSDWVKIVTTANYPEDGARMVRLYKRMQSLPNTKLIAFAMGEEGKPSRFASGLLGPFTFAALGEATAPGQPTLKELRDFYENMPIYEQVLRMLNLK